VRGLPRLGRVAEPEGLFRHAGLRQALEEHVAVGEIGEVTAQDAEARRRADFVAGRNILLRFLDELRKNPLACLVIAFNR
jgi:hypothetical protein